MIRWVHIMYGLVKFMLAWVLLLFDNTLRKKMNSVRRKVRSNERNICRSVKKDTQLSFRRHIENVPSVKPNCNDLKESLLCKQRLEKDKKLRTRIPQPMARSLSLLQSQNACKVLPNIHRWDRFKSRLPVLMKLSRHAAQKCIKKTENAGRSADWKRNSVVKTGSAPNHSVESPAPNFSCDVSPIEQPSFAPLEFTFEAPENVKDFSFLLLRTSSVQKSLRGKSGQEKTDIKEQSLLCDKSSKRADADIIVEKTSVELQNDEVIVPTRNIIEHVSVFENSKSENICDDCILKLPMNEHSSFDDSNSDNRVTVKVSEVPNFSAHADAIVEKSSEFSDREVTVPIINGLQHDLLSPNLNCDENIYDERACLSPSDTSDLCQSRKSDLVDSVFSTSHSPAVKLDQCGSNVKIKKCLSDNLQNLGVKHRKFSNSCEFLNSRKVENEFNIFSLLKKEHELCCNSQTTCYMISTSGSLLDTSSLFDISKLEATINVSLANTGGNGRKSSLEDIEAESCLIEDVSLYDVSKLPCLELSPSSEKCTGKHNSSACKVGRNCSKGSSQANFDLPRISSSILCSPLSSNGGLKRRARRDMQSPVRRKPLSNKENEDAQTSEIFHISKLMNDELMSPKPCKSRISLLGSPLCKCSPQRVIRGDLIMFSPPVRF